MIVILCNSFDDVKDGYNIFLDYLENIDPWSIKRELKASYCVETDDDLRYVFIDYRFKNLFKTFGTPDFIDLDEFLEGLFYY